MTRKQVSVSLWRGAILTAAILAAGCASNGPRASSGMTADAIAPSTALAADSPMAASQAIQSADFALQAQQQGYQTVARDGKVFYCWSDQSIGSRIQSTKCLDEAQLRLRMRQQEQQRQAMEHSLAGPKCPQGMACN
jgi:hypothetical protein